MNVRWKWLLLTLALLASLGAVSQPQPDFVTYERYDVDIAVQQDGSLLVAETYRIRFVGEFHTGFAEIPLEHIDKVSNIQVWEGSQAYSRGGSGPGTFSVENGGYASLSSGSTNPPAAMRCAPLASSTGRWAR